jgi:hypothetical protein
MQCEHDGCHNEAKTRKLGNLCLKHYKRAVRHGTTHLPKKSVDKKCKYCDRTVGEKGGGARGMCNRHYQNWLRHDDPLYTDKIRSSLGSRGYVKRVNGKDKHRQVYEDFLGRQLERNEIIHHINLVKNDNRIENLYLCKGAKEHSLIHKQLESVAGKLVEKGIIDFENGEYILKGIL